jgi:tetratricopeptide (TPR) repeat protein
VELTAGNADRAIECFIKVRDRQATPKVFLQWYWRMISEFGLVGAYLRLGKLDTASAAADQFLKDALTTADPALQAPAWDAVARIATLMGDTKRAFECIGQALECIKHLDLPSVAWRVHATAANLYSQSGNQEAAARHRDFAAASLRLAASSFGRGDPLHQSLMAASDSVF